MGNKLKTLVIFGLFLGSCAPQTVEVPQTVVVEQTVVVPQTVEVEVTREVEKIVQVTTIVEKPVTVTPSPTPPFTPTPSNTPTITPTPTKTSTPTRTPTFTPSPTPTKSPTPTPNPFALAGRGDSVVDLKKPDPTGPALLKISYAGGGNFAIWSYDAQGEQMELLVNVVGTYTGTVPVDFFDHEQTARLQIEGSGQWTIDVLALDAARVASVPGTFSGYGDDVVVFSGGDPDLLKIDASTAKSNFVIWAYGSSRDLLVNEIAPYDGVVVAGSDTILLVIEATRAWKIEVTER